MGVVRCSGQRAPARHAHRLLAVNSYFCLLLFSHITEGDTQRITRRGTLIWHDLYGGVPNSSQLEAPQVRGHRNHGRALHGRKREAQAVRTPRARPALPW